MEENKNEEVVEQITEQPKVDDTVEKIKVKKKPTMKKLSQDDEVIKVDLNTPPTPKEDEKTKEDVTDDGGVVEFTEDANATQEQEEVQSEIETQETPVLEEVTEEKVEELTEQVEEAVAEAKATGKELPENITKLMEFMEDTGGDLEDYIKLNQDYAKLDNHTLLKEYYKQTKTHLEDEEIDFLMEDQFSYDEDIDDEKDIKRKKLALKEQVANARTQLEESKSKYYEDIKAGSKLTGEQQKAVDFFNRYNKESEGTKKTVKKNTEFKGFEYEVGEKKFRFNVKDVGGVKESQSDLNNFMSKFVNKDLSLNDAEGYHRSLFTAMNADKIANHFYEQGKADALKNSVAKSKNISMDPRQQHSGEINAGGIKVRVLGENSNDFKFKIKNK